LVPVTHLDYVSSTQFHLLSITNNHQPKKFLTKVNEQPYQPPVANLTPIVQRVESDLLPIAPLFLGGDITK